MRSTRTRIFGHRDSLGMGLPFSHTSPTIECNHFVSSAIKSIGDTDKNYCDKIQDHNTRNKISPKNADSARRVIFPSLHRSNSTPDTKVVEKFHSVRSFKKSSSCNSIDCFGMKTAPSLFPIAKKIPSLSKEVSPKSVAALKSSPLPLIPSLVGPAVESHKVKIDPSILIIPPFKHKVDASPCLIPIGKSKMTKENLIATERTFLMKRQRYKKSFILTSILRKEDQDFTPSVVPLSESEDSLVNKVRFDPRVWVHQFQREKEELITTWFSGDEMDRFKQRAIERVWSFTELVPTGTGRLVRKPFGNSKALFTNPALLADDEEDNLIINRMVRIEVRRILVIDPHDLCAKLFKKSLRKIFTNAEITTAISSGEALRCIECKGGNNSFDLFLVEERLKIVQGREDHNCSGSGLIKLLKKKYNGSIERSRHALFIGISAHFEQDKDKLLKGGAALTWPKPPPGLDEAMRNRILKELLVTRGKKDTLRYFSDQI